MHICYIANKYPSKYDPNVLVFVQQLVWALADEGHTVSVISPIPLNINPKYFDIPFSYIENTEDNNRISVYRPKTIGFGQSKYFFGKSPIKITTHFIETASKRAISHMPSVPDVFIGHFAAPAGVVAARLAKQFKKKGYFAFGDFSTVYIDQFGRNSFIKECRDIDGVIAVSSRNKRLLSESNIIPQSKIGIFPNGNCPSRFSPIERNVARKKLGIDESVFVVGFVGTYSDRKGIKRLEYAVDAIEGVALACAGSGELHPKSPKCIFDKKIPNDLLPWFYAALDVFALPTLEEGCSNAIVEALAMGLPIISSDRDFNIDIIDDTCAILIDPMDVSALSNAILELKNNYSKRKSLVSGSLQKSKELTLSKRARNIIEFIS